MFKILASILFKKAFVSLISGGSIYMILKALYSVSSSYLSIHMALTMTLIFTLISILTGLIVFSIGLIIELYKMYKLKGEVENAKSRINVFENKLAIFSSQIVQAPPLPTLSFDLRINGFNWTRSIDGYLKPVCDCGSQCSPTSNRYPAFFKCQECKKEHYITSSESSSYLDAYAVFKNVNEQFPIYLPQKLLT